MVLLSNDKMTDKERKVILKSKKMCKKKSNWFVDHVMITPFFSLDKEKHHIEQVVIQGAHCHSIKVQFPLLYGLDELKFELKRLNCLVALQDRSWFTK